MSLSVDIAGRSSGWSLSGQFLNASLKAFRELDNVEECSVTCTLNEMRINLGARRSSEFAMCWAVTCCLTARLARVRMERNWRVSMITLSVGFVRVRHTHGQEVVNVYERVSKGGAGWIPAAPWGLPRADSLAAPSSWPACSSLENATTPSRAAAMHITCHRSRPTRLLLRCDTMA